MNVRTIRMDRLLVRAVPLSHIFNKSVKHGNCWIFVSATNVWNVLHSAFAWWQAYKYGTTRTILCQYSFFISLFPFHSSAWNIVTIAAAMTPRKSTMSAAPPVSKLHSLVATNLAKQERLLWLVNATCVRSQGRALTGWAAGRRSKSMRRRTFWVSSSGSPATGRPTKCWTILRCWD